MLKEMSRKSKTIFSEFNRIENQYLHQFSKVCKQVMIEIEEFILKQNYVHARTYVHELPIKETVKKFACDRIDEMEAEIEQRIKEEELKPRDEKLT